MSQPENIEKMAYRDKLEAFRSSCRVYRQEKSMLDKMTRREAVDAAERQYIRYVQEDVRFVENMLDQINEKCGPNARVLIWKLFVQNETQAAVAAEFYLTRRQLQYAVEKWLKAVFADENEKEDSDQ